MCGAWSGLKVRKRLLSVALLLVGFAATPASSWASSIIYRCGNPANLCEINADGTGQKQLTTDGASAAYHGASIDLAGDRMVFSRDTSNLFAADGNAKNVVGPISTYAQTPKISFDGTRVVDAEYFPTDSAYGICSFQTTPSSDPNWGRQCGVGFTFPAFGPGGEIVASTVANGHEIVCLVVPGQFCSRNVATDPSHDLLEAAISPDGQTLAVVAVTPGGSDPAGGSIVLYSMSSGTLLRSLTNGTVDETPAWSPDGTQIVFSRSGSLYTISSSGSPGSEHLLVSGGDTPTWSPATIPTAGPNPGSTSSVPGKPQIHTQISHASHKAKFTFSDEGAAQFQCSLVQMKTGSKTKPKPHYSGCHSPKTYNGLRSGRYEFFLRGLSSGGTAGKAKTKNFSI